MKNWKWLKAKLSWKVFLIILSVALVGAFFFPKNLFLTPLGNITDVKITGDTLEITVGLDKMIVQVCKPELLKVDYRPGGAPSLNTPVVGNTKWGAVGATIDTSSDPNQIVITTSRMVAKIQRTPCRLSVYDPSNRFLLKDEGDYDNKGVKFTHNGGDIFYGVGSYNAWSPEANTSAGMICNDKKPEDLVVKAGCQGHCGGPMIFTTNYGLLIDSASFSEPVLNSDSASDNGFFTITGTGLNFSNVSKQNVEYYVAVGTPREVLPALAAVTGKPPMFPKSVMGFINSQWGFKDDKQGDAQKEFVDIIDQYRTENIPIDWFIFDVDGKGWEEDSYGPWLWNSFNFPEGNNGDLKKLMDPKGIKMGGIMKPRIITKLNGIRTVQAKDCDDNNYWYPNEAEYPDYLSKKQARDIDFSNADARKWYSDLAKDAIKNGPEPVWLDEADYADIGNNNKKFFNNFQFYNMQKALYEGWTTAFPSKRVWSLNRNFYLGAQRYAYGVWSGDIGLTKNEEKVIVKDFKTMAVQRLRMLEAVNIGAVKWTMDCGFGEGDLLPQNYTRWLQFGAFVPIFRVHAGEDKRRQPWYFGSTGEEVAKQAIQLRYRLLPYIYAYERQAYETGLGIVRPLFYDYPTDKTIANKIDAWMFGDWLLVAPVVDFGQHSKSIYLPAGKWIDYFRGDQYDGNKNIPYPVNADTWTDIPLFIKEGAIIPSQEVQDFVGQRPVKTVNVDIFPSTVKTRFTYYDDQGEGYDYKKGVYFKQLMTTQDNGASGISFDIEARSGSYKPDLQFYLAAIHGNAGNNVKINGATVKHYSDLNALKTALGEGWVSERDLYGPVTYVKIAAQSPNDKKVVVSGNTSVSSTAMKYEAEEASLTGGTVINTNHAGYSGPGFAAGFTKIGAMATFSVNVKTGGVYNVKLRYANATGSAKSLSILINGERMLKTELPNQANWDVWANKTEQLPLVAGNNVISYQYDNDDSGKVNLDYIETPFEAEAARYEAESAELTGGAATNSNHFFYSGGAFVEGMNAIGAAANFSVYAPAAGNYYLALRYANAGGTDRKLSLLVNGALVGQVSLPKLPNWDQWADKVSQITLKAGMNTVTYQYLAGDSGNVNLDRILISKTTPPKIPVTENNFIANGNFEHGDISGWTEWHNGGSRSVNVNFYDVKTRDKKCEFYNSNAFEQSIHQVCTGDNGDYQLTACVRLRKEKTGAAEPKVAQVEIDKYDGAPISLDLIPLMGKGWTYITIDNIKVTAGKVDVGFYLNSPGETKLSFDDVKLIRK
ncbi:MAG TPA: TIM-barrel domain-containing protein [Bacillota bacterium]|nr:TIM-barrel domain-containing protein [Bacillota bacterium]